MKTNRKARTPEFYSWKNMIGRCKYPRHPKYKWYGARGITVCARWKKFKSFITDMGERPSPSHTLERIDNNDGYYPGNCKWATRKEQAINRRVCVIVSYQGITDTLGGWSRRVGIDRNTLAKRIRSGWSITKVFETPPGNRNACRENRLSKKARSMTEIR